MAAGPRRREDATAEEGRALTAVALGRDFEVEPGARLPTLDQPQADAYAARDRRGARRDLFALLCHPGVVPRLPLLSALSRLERLPFVAPLAAEAVSWPGAGPEQRFLLVLTRPQGPRLASAGEPRFRPFTEEQLLEGLLRPLLPLLRELATQGIAHRNIRPDNLFLFEAAARGLGLGDCFAAAAGLDQPPLYEPIEAMLADPRGRGAGETADDLYALGATAAVLLQGGPPSIEPAALLKAKLARGSYAALLGALRPSMQMIELLRGLLADDPAERWSLEDLSQWINGRRLTPKQALQPPRASRTYDFAGVAYDRPQALAAAVAKDWARGQNLLGDPQLVRWLGRSLGEEKRAARLADLFSTLPRVEGAPLAKPEADRALARVLLLLDPQGPLRLRALSARPEGLAQLLALAFEEEETRQAVAEAIADRLPQAWFEVQDTVRPEQIALRRAFEQMALILSRRQPGYGLERCLYEFNPGWPCLSPLLAGRKVVEIGELLEALEQAAAASDRRREPVDRHIAAFVAARLRSFPEQVLMALSGEAGEVARRLAQVALLAELQRRRGPPSLPALAAWSRELLGPAVESFHSRALRREIAAEMEEAAAAGDLLRLLAAADSLPRRERDARGFAEAVAAYRASLAESAWLENGGLTAEAVVERLSQQSAAVASGCLSGLGLLVMTIAFLL